MKLHVIFGLIGVFLGAMTGLSLVWPELGVIVGTVGTASSLGAAYLLSEGE